MSVFGLCGGGARMPRRAGRARRFPARTCWQRCCAVLDENNFLLLLFCVNWKTLVSSTRGSRSESWGCSLRNGGVP